MQPHDGKGDGDTRARLITAAERLFAEHGISGVSMREVNRSAGARNAVAVQYHFGDREGLVRAVLAKHWPAVDARRHAMLDEYEAQGPAAAPGLRMLAAALVRPLAAKLADDDDGGIEYLQVFAEVVNRPRSGDEPDQDAGLSRTGDSIQRWRAFVAPFLEEDAARLHRRFTAIRFSASELGRRAASGRHADDRLFAAHLIDLVEALLLAPISGETKRLADERDASRPPIRPSRRARAGGAATRET